MMTKIKLCGLSREEDIEAVNELMPEYIGFVFWKNSRRYVSPERAKSLKKILAPEISATGVFVDEKPEIISEIVDAKIIDVIQLHGHEDNKYIFSLRKFTDKPIIKAFKSERINDAQKSTADYVMFDSGMGTGKLFDWSEINITRKYFLAGGLAPDNVRSAINKLKPFAVDVSSGIETAGVKDKVKMKAFVDAVRVDTVRKEKNHD